MDRHHGLDNHFTKLETGKSKMFFYHGTCDCSRTFSNHFLITGSILIITNEMLSVFMNAMSSKLLAMSSLFFHIYIF